ncbi:MAG: alpha-N-arabinofuranosidase [Chitinophagaceae bacterium]|nr:alpha-N-arabinofuranosidase [Chitinophagaceae bacterium]
MKKFKTLLAVLLMLTLTGLGQVSITIEAGPARDTISRHIYGHFAEHLGRCIYDGFYVGEGNKTIPNRDGIRLDIIDALKKLQVPNLRWPGGCFADTYHWKDGIGLKKNRPTMINTWWGNTTEDNSFGTHEFLQMCEMLGAEPYLSGNVGSGTPQELADWVKYTNHPNGSSPMPVLRQQNGRATPWGVRFWGIGNEAWGCGGNMTAEFYANIYRQYTTFMTSGGGQPLYRIASGANGGDYHWTEVLMRDIPKHLLDGVGVHHYSVIDWNAKGSATRFTDAQYFATMKQALRMEELVTKHSAIMDKYDPKNEVAMIVDEWGGWYDVEPGTNGAFLFQQNTMRDAMIAGTTLNTFNNHARRVKMANLAQTVNVLQAVILTEGNKLLLTPTYHVMEMYKVHQDAALLPSVITTPDFMYDNDKLPAVSVSASRDKSGTIHISLVNIDPGKSQELRITLNGQKISAVSAGRVLAAASIQAHNTFADPGRVKPMPFNGASIQEGALRLEMPPASVIVLTLK